MGRTKIKGDLEVTGGLIADVQATAGSIGTAELASGAVTLAKLATGVTPSHVVKYAGTVTTAGGSANEAKTVTGVATSDIVMAMLAVAGGTPRALVGAKVTATNTITFYFDGDPSTDHQVAYTVFRAVA